MPVPTRKSADDRKAEIVATVLRLADELGPDRLTTSAVAQAIGLTQPAVFRHFPTKQSLWLAAAEGIAESMSEAWNVALAQTNDPVERIGALIGVQLRQIEANPAIPAILHSRELHAENEGLRETLISLMTRFHGMLVAEMEEAGRSKILRKNLAPQDGATLLISLVQGLAIRWSLGKRAFALEPEGKRVLAVQMALFLEAPSPETLQ